MNSVIYFARSGSEGPIKIGRTQNLKKRIETLQTYSPHDIQLLGTAVGGILKEKETHRLFSNSRIRGEWFLPTKDLLQFIKFNAVSCGLIEKEEASEAHWPTEGSEKL